MTESIHLPAGFDWLHWIKHWDRMQEHYLVNRVERFATIAHLIGGTQPAAARVLDLGCGPGSLTSHLLETLPQSEIAGVDFDPTLLLLAEPYLARFEGRVKLIHANLRDVSWWQNMPGRFDAVVSTTALHWLPPEHLRILYGQIFHLLREGGIFLNADHVGSDFPAIQKAWEAHREAMRMQEKHVIKDDIFVSDWGGFWEAYGRALGVNVNEIHQQMADDGEDGPEDGMPLTWHLDMLRAQGFHSVDCFWRSDCDAIYGGIR